MYAQLTLSARIKPKDWGENDDEWLEDM